MKQTPLAAIAAIMILLHSTGLAGEPKKPGQDGKNEAQSQEQTDWEAKVSKRFRKNPAFRFVKDDPKLPRVLLIGDSISIGYTPAVRKALAGKANVHRIPENGGDTSRGLQKLKMWLGTKKWDVIHVNWGLHDLKRYSGKKMDVKGKQVRTPEEYAENLGKLVAQLEETGAALIWASTTPVPAGARGRMKGDEVTFNAAAAKVMEKQGVPINDLYGHVLPKLKSLQNNKDVHFKASGSTHLGKKVAEEISKVLGTKGSDPKEK